MKYLRLFLCFCLLTCNVVLQAKKENIGRIQFHQLGENTSLSRATISGIYQDEFGALWIGTHQGIRRYDGRTIENVEIAGGISGVSSMHHPSVCGNKDGLVYFNIDYRIIEYNLLTDSAKVIFSQLNTEVPPILSMHYGKDNLWIGLDNHLFAYKEGKISLYISLKDAAAEISSVWETADGVYVGTKRHGLFYANKQRNVHRLHEMEEIITLFEDSQHNIWIGTVQDGLYKRAASGKFLHYLHGDTQTSLLSNYVRAVAEDNLGNIWIGTMLGVNCLKPSTGEISSYGVGKANVGLTNLSVWVITKDKTGTMWFGTYYGGVNYCNPGTDMFTEIDILPNANPIISKISEDQYGHLWIGTEGNGLIRYDQSSGNAFSVLPPSSHNIKSLLYDKKRDKLWIGLHLGGLVYYDIKKREICLRESQNLHSIGKDIVHGLAISRDTLYIATLSDIYRYGLIDGSLEKVKALQERFFEIRDLLVDKSGLIWISGNRLGCFNPITQELRFLDKEIENVAQSKNVFTTCLFQTSKGEIIIGTSGKGLVRFCPDINKWSIYNQNIGLHNNHITCLGEMKESVILAGSADGISCIDMMSGRNIEFDVSNGFQLSLSPGCIVRLASGDMVIGGLDGISLLNRDLFEFHEHPTSLYLSRLWINNKEIKLRDGSGILQKTFRYTNKLNLKWNENNMSFAIGNDNLTKGRKINCQYKLAGFDKEWIPFSPQDLIRYTNLPYGDYKLLVRMPANVSQCLSLDISVAPPWFLSWYAYVCYVLFLIYAIYLFQSKLKLKMSLELERREKLHQQEVAHEKQVFFANISHELRTPLTLIIGKLELLLMREGMPLNLFSNLKETLLNATQMNTLLSELLEVFKYDQRNIHLRNVNTDVVKFMHSIFLSFSSLMELKEINYTFYSEKEEEWIGFDPQQMRKVFNNLLSNALKYTHKGGCISVSVKSNADQVFIDVKDTGIGIPDDMKERIFERFVRVENASNSKGTGIGLSLSRCICEAHGGTLDVESKIGEGSNFTVSIPKYITATTMDKETNDWYFQESEALTSLEDKHFLSDLCAFNENGQLKLLIVEDDEQLRNMLIQIFKPYFSVYEAKNGREGFNIASSQTPDIVISDIMMPIMSGRELCKKIKSNFETSHIPVILLTALEGIDFEVEGYNWGADDYISKPFSIKLLFVRCINLLKNRRLMQKRFKSSENDSAQIVTTTTIDRAFLEKAISIVEENIPEGNINVDLLASKLGISRTKLYAKMKGVIGESPHDFIQSIKLKVAAKLLRECPEKNISDITFYLGFSSLNYFGKYFKDAFGMSPTSYRKKFWKDVNKGNSGDACFSPEQFDG